MRIIDFSFYFIVFLLLIGCTKSKEEIDALFQEEDLRIEIAKDVEILYSDSAQVQMKITATTLKRKVDRIKSVDEFPDGVFVEFYDNNGRIISWLEANYAIRKEGEDKIFVKDDVKLFNQKNDQLETDELIWDEKAGELYTNKFVRIAQPEIGDTSAGYGFRAKQEFQRFEIMKRVSAIKKVDLTELLESK